MNRVEEDLDEWGRGEGVGMVLDMGHLFIYLFFKNIFQVLLSDL